MGSSSWISSKMALVPCIAISTGYILLIMFLCELLRKAIAPLNDGLVKTALNEAIAAADLCGVCFELIIIADNYGLAAYGLYLFLATIWWSLHWVMPLLALTTISSHVSRET